MKPAAAALDAWRAAGEGAGALPEVRAALDTDLDTPGALRAIDAAAAAGQGVSQAGRTPRCRLSRPQAKAAHPRRPLLQSAAPRNGAGPTSPLP